MPLLTIQGSITNGQVNQNLPFTFYSPKRLRSITFIYKRTTLPGTVITFGLYEINTYTVRGISSTDYCGSLNIGVHVPAGIENSFVQNIFNIGIISNGLRFRNFGTMNGTASFIAEFESIKNLAPRRWIRGKS